MDINTLLNTILIFILLIGISLVIVYFYNKSIIRPWSMVAERLGLTFESGNVYNSLNTMKVRGIYHGHEIVLDPEFKPTINPFHNDFATRLALTLNKPAKFSLLLTQEGIIDKLGKALGLQDIQTGDEELDRHLIIKGGPEAVVRAVLSNSSLRQKLLETHPVYIVVDGGQIYYEKQGVEKNREVLISLFDLLTTLADATERQ